MVAKTHALTYDDLAEMADDGRRHELIGGDLIVSPSPVTAHQRVLIRLAALLFELVTRHRLGEIFTAPYDVKLTASDVVEPDILFVSRARRRIIGPACVEGAPDLVIEILSPSTRDVDEWRKADLYAAHGVREYWLIDPEAHALRILLLDAAGQYEAVPQHGGFARSVVLPGFAVEMAALFAELD